VLPCGAGGWRSNCAKRSSTVGLDYDFRLAPPLCPIRLRRPPRRAPLAAPPAYKDHYSSARVLVRWVLDYSSQDILPPEAWSLRP
jgi:hypothetical protein